MSTSAIIVVLVAVVVIGVAAAVLAMQVRRRRLRNRFGPEYDRVLHTTDDRRAAERELLERERRHADLEIRPLSEDSRVVYTERWSRVQEQFVDAPAEAVAEADRLVTDLLAEVGYPRREFEQQAADLSVDHPDAAEPYRRAHRVLADGDSGDGQVAESADETDELRRALLDYRVVFDAVSGHKAGSMSGARS
ncbi:MAG TPA: hypothetical protein VJT49_11250 [Amycolatopsis sp.]|uniref:hypothetical protein n=1 Tax=Amycolatopsis sp. TaxID=37632 RepID=UPI002B4953D2|nr:hypothetical protein [Amycolatopsis sp.]HKS45666.1 hypothetical protein [Amycolatopsis sp.]